MLLMQEKQFLAYLSLERKFEGETLRSTLIVFRLFAKWLDNKPFTLQNCRMFLLEKQSFGITSGYLSTFVAMLRHYAEFSKKDFSEQIPYPKRVRKLPDVLTLDEIEKIVSCPRPKKNKPKWDLVFEILAKTGIRCGELCNIKVLDVKDNLIHLRDTKTDQDRFVPLCTQLKEKIKNWSENKNPDGYLFVTKSGKKLKEQDVNFELKSRCRTANIRSVHPHLFRHSFVTEMLRANPPGGVAVISKIVGHSNPLMTLTTYQHLIVEDMITAINYHPLVRKDQLPSEVLQRFKEMVESAGFKNNKRFFYKIDESENGLSVVLYIK